MKSKCTDINFSIRFGNLCNDSPIGSDADSAEVFEIRDIAEVVIPVRC